MKENLLTQSDLHSLLEYNSETGEFKWKVTAANNSIKVGTVAGYSKVNGYICIGIKKLEYYAHRLAWLYVYGVWPKEQIDHINRIRIDNRINNLRSVSNQINVQNQGLRKGSVSGVKGVNWYKKNKKWQARINYNKKTLHVGYYENFDDARFAREIAEMFCWVAPLELNKQMHNQVDAAMTGVRK
jgi:hypothetical protein